jgi:glycosyltransferase involved in cell wall biosynthesis
MTVEEVNNYDRRKQAAGLNVGFYGIRALSDHERYSPTVSSESRRAEFEARDQVDTSTARLALHVDTSDGEVELLRRVAPCKAIRAAFAAVEPLAAIEHLHEATADTSYPVYSILTAYFRHLALFQRCAASVESLFEADFAVLGQRRIEWIVVNDDPYLNVDELLACVPASIRPFTQIASDGANRGMSTRLNQASSLAQGEWFLLLDCDDEIEPESTLVLDHYRAGFPSCRYISSAMTDIDENGHVLRRRVHSQDPTALFEAGMIAGHLVSIHDSLFLELGGFGEEFSGCQDYDLALRAAQREPLLVIPEYLYRYRWHGASQTLGSKARQAKHTVAVLRAFLLRFGKTLAPASFLAAAQTAAAPLRAGYCIIRTLGNRLELLSEAVGSVLGQPIPIIPLVVVHGGAETQALVREWLVLHNLPSKIVGAPNTARKRGYPMNIALDQLRFSAGSDEFFFFLDDDDILYPFFSNRLVRLLELSGADIAVAVANQRVPWHTTQIGHQLLPVSALAAGNFIPIHCYAVRVDFLQRSGARFREDMDYLEDWDFLVGLLGSGGRFHLIDDVLCEYRIIGDGNTLVKRDPEHFDDCVDRVMARSRLIAQQLGLGRYCRDLATFDFDMRSDVTSDTVRHLLDARKLFSGE